MKILNLTRVLQIIHNGRIIKLKYSDCIEVVDCKLVIMNQVFKSNEDIIIRGSELKHGEKVQKDASKFIRDGTLYIDGVYQQSFKQSLDRELSVSRVEKIKKTNDATLVDMLSEEQYNDIIEGMRCFFSDEMILDKLNNAIIDDSQLQRLIKEEFDQNVLDEAWNTNVENGLVHSVKSLSDIIFDYTKELISVLGFDVDNIHYDPLYTLEKLEHDSNIYVKLDHGLILHGRYGVMSHYKYIELLAFVEAYGDDAARQELLESYNKDLITKMDARTSFAENFDVLTRDMLLETARYFVEYFIIKIHLEGGLITLAYTREDLDRITTICNNYIWKLFKQEQYKDNIIHYSSQLSNPMMCETELSDEDYQMAYQNALLRVRLNCKSRAKQIKCLTTAFKDSIKLGASYTYDSSYRRYHHEVTMFIIVYILAFLILSSLETLGKLDNLLTISSIIPLVLHFYQIDFGNTLSDWQTVWYDVRDDWNWMFMIVLYITFICIKTIDLSDPVFMLIMNPLTAVFNSITLLLLDQLRKSFYSKVYLVLQILFFIKSYIEVYFLDYHQKELLISIANVSFSTILLNLIRKLLFFSKPIIRQDDTICVYSTKPVTYMQTTE